MRQVVSDVYLMEGLHGGNVYALASGASLVADEGLTLVDSSVAGDVESIVAQLEEAGYALSRLRAIVLTHAHGDHVGGAVALARRSGAQVAAHRDEVPYIERRKPMPSSSIGQRLLNWLSDRVFFRLSPCPVDRPLEDGELIEALGGLQVVHTPGHTPGSICLYHPERQIVFCGDALFNANPMTGEPGLRFPISMVTIDRGRARDSVAKLSKLDVQVLCPGHGEPIVEGAGTEIKALLDSADRA
jgi:glyoxylase-like metal-dependent hydrolase (beta-lactamase superfamily II)